MNHGKMKGEEYEKYMGIRHGTFGSREVRGSLPRSSSDFRGGSLGFFRRICDRLGFSVFRLALVELRDLGLCLGDVLLRDTILCSGMSALTSVLGERSTYG